VAGVEHRAEPAADVADRLPLQAAAGWHASGAIHTRMHAPWDGNPLHGVVRSIQESGADFTGWNPLSWGARE
jgi:hypothetical protein